MPINYLLLTLKKEEVFVNDGQLISRKAQSFKLNEISFLLQLMQSDPTQPPTWQPAPFVSSIQARTNDEYDCCCVSVPPDYR